MIVRVIKVLEIFRECRAFNRGGWGGCGLTRNSSGMYVVRELPLSKQGGLIYR